MRWILNSDLGQKVDRRLSSVSPGNLAMFSQDSSNLVADSLHRIEQRFRVRRNESDLAASNLPIFGRL
jgi:hypothetical protein